MRFLICGLGSMGKRRIRCLKKLGYCQIMGFDLREDRRAEVSKKYKIETIARREVIPFDRVDAVIVSTPPDKHDPFIKMALEHRKPVFVEASVVLGKLPILRKMAQRIGVPIVPSSTLRYHPAIKKIIEISKKRIYGKITNFNYYFGQYLPDWHPYEPLKGFYASKKATGAAREIVPFELTWLLELTGLPEKVCGVKGKTMDLGADIDDTYAAVFRFKNKIIGTLTVDCVSRYATRSLILNFENGQILWRWDEPIVKIYDARSRQWTFFKYSQGKAAKGYNKNITEDMYVDELAAFIQAIKRKGRLPNTIDEDIEILKLLVRIENSAQ